MSDTIPPGEPANVPSDDETAAAIKTLASRGMVALPAGLVLASEDRVRAIVADAIREGLADLLSITPPAQKHIQTPAPAEAPDLASERARKKLGYPR